MKLTTTGKSHNRDWCGLNITTKVPLSWSVTIETVCWETWKVTVTTSNGVTGSIILRKVGNEQPSVLIKRLPFHRYMWTSITGNLNVCNCEGK